MAAKRTENSKRAGQFEKGKSGNPGGRPKVSADVKEMLKAAAPQAAALLIETVNDPEVKIDLRIKCAETLMDRVYGKAVQPIEGNMDNRVEIVLGGATKYAD